MRPARFTRFLLLVLLACAFVAPVTADETGASTYRSPSGPSLYRKFHPQFLKSTSGPASVVYLRNAGYNPADAMLDFHSPSGAYVASPMVMIPPGGAVEFPAADLAVADGVYGLVVSSTEPLETVVRTLAPGEGETLATYRGQLGATALRLGPVSKGSPDTSITVLNSGNIATTVSVKFLSSAGVLVHTASESIEFCGSKTFDTAALPPGFAGSALVEAAEPVSAILQVSDPAGLTVTEQQDPLAAGSTLACVARGLKHFDQGTGPRSTTLFVTNTQTAAGNVQVSFYDAAGSAVLATPAFTVPGQGTVALRLADLASLPAGAWAACAAGDQPLAMSELTSFDAPGFANEAAYAVRARHDGSYNIYAPRLANDGSGHSVLTLQNTGNSNATGTFYIRNMQGTAVYQQAFTLPPRGWREYDLALIPETGAGFQGTAEAVSDAPLAAIVDELGPRPAAIGDASASITLSRQMQLDWTAVAQDMRGQAIAGATYHVYRAGGSPYFLPAAGAEPYAPDLPAPAFIDGDAGVLSEAGEGVYYLVKAAYAGALGEPSNRVAAFVFGLEPGCGGAGVR